MSEYDRPVLLVQMGDTPESMRGRAGNFDDMFCDCGLDRQLMRRVHVRNGERPGSVSEYRAAIITGSIDMVTDRAPWSEYAAEWLRGAFAAGLSLLGVCFGHQLLAHALGGEIGYLPGGPEVGTHPVRMAAAAAADPLFAKLPPVFNANLAHGQTIAALPEGAVALAESERDRFQIVRYGEKAVSVQFHPEFTGAVMAAFAAAYAAADPGEAKRYEDLRNAARDTPEAATLIPLFLESAR